MKARVHDHETVTTAHCARRPWQADMTAGSALSVFLACVAIGCLILAFIQGSRKAWRERHLGAFAFLVLFGVGMLAWAVWGIATNQPTDDYVPGPNLPTAPGVLHPSTPNVFVSGGP